MKNLVGPPGGALPDLERDSSAGMRDVQRIAANADLCDRLEWSGQMETGAAKLQRLRLETRLAGNRPAVQSCGAVSFSTHDVLSHATSPAVEQGQTAR